MEMGLMRMDVPVGQQAKEMQRSPMRVHGAQDFLPGVALKHAARGHGRVYSLRTLINPPTIAKGIMSSFTVTDIVITRLTHCRAVGSECRIEPILLEPMHRGCPRQTYRIAKTPVTRSYPVHD